MTSLSFNNSICVQGRSPPPAAACDRAQSAGHQRTADCVRVDRLTATHQLDRLPGELVKPGRYLLITLIMIDGVYHHR